MKGWDSFIVSPIRSRYDNTKKVGDVDLILNTEIFTHTNVSNNAIVVGLPKNKQTDIQIGDEVIIHHNVFRRWHDVRGNEQNSRSFFSEDKYFVGEEQLYIYKHDDEWKSLDDYCFVKPIVNDDMFSLEKEKPLVGIVKYSNDILKSRGIEVGDKIGFIPNSEFEFVIDGERVYRVRTKVITIKYEYEGEEREYNPSWV
jgi:hypothetical protein|tara:strand:+ start:1113 stop:1709 length:597 start_codon:yes stop_codon:yes gene_type:complete